VGNGPEQKKAKICQQNDVREALTYGGNVTMDYKTDAVGKKGRYEDGGKDVGGKRPCAQESWSPKGSSKVAR